MGGRSRDSHAYLGGLGLAWLGLAWLGGIGWVVSGSRGGKAEGWKGLPHESVSLSSYLLVLSPETKLEGGRCI